MKKIVFTIVGGIVISMSVFLLAYYSFTFFNNRKSSNDVDTLEISLEDEGSLNLMDQEPVNGMQIDTVSPYKFTVKNKNNEAVQYEILLEDLVVNDNLNKLNRSYLQYQLKEDNNVLVADRLSNIKNNVIYRQTIGANLEKKYELRISIVDGIEDEEWVGKVYRYSVKLNPLID